MKPTPPFLPRISSASGLTRPTSAKKSSKEKLQDLIRGLRSDNLSEVGVHSPISFATKTFADSRKKILEGVSKLKEAHASAKERVKRKLVDEGNSDLTLQTNILGSLNKIQNALSVLAKPSGLDAPNTGDINSVEWQCKRIGDLLSKIYEKLTTYELGSDAMADTVTSFCLPVSPIIPAGETEESFYAERFKYASQQLAASFLNEGEERNKLDAIMASLLRSEAEFTKFCLGVEEIHEQAERKVKEDEERRAEALRLKQQQEEAEAVRKQQEQAASASLPPIAPFNPDRSITSATGPTTAEVVPKIPEPHAKKQSSGILSPRSSVAGSDSGLRRKSEVGSHHHLLPIPSGVVAKGVRDSAARIQEENERKKQEELKKSEELSRRNSMVSSVVGAQKEIGADDGRRSGVQQSAKEKKNEDKANKRKLIIDEIIRLGTAADEPVSNNNATAAVSSAPTASAASSSHAPSNEVSAAILLNRIFADTQPSGKVIGEGEFYKTFDPKPLNKTGSSSQKVAKSVDTQQSLDSNESYQHFKELRLSNYCTNLASSTTEDTKKKITSFCENYSSMGSDEAIKSEIAALFKSVKEEKEVMEKKQKEELKRKIEEEQQRRTEAAERRRVEAEQAAEDFKRDKSFFEALKKHIRSEWETKITAFKKEYGSYKDIIKNLSELSAQKVVSSGFNNAVITFNNLVQKAESAIGAYLENPDADLKKRALQKQEASSVAEATNVISFNWTSDKQHSSPTEGSGKNESTALIKIYLPKTRMGLNEIERIIKAKKEEAEEVLKQAVSDLKSPLVLKLTELEQISLTSEEITAAEVAIGAITSGEGSKKNPHLKALEIAAGKAPQSDAKTAFENACNEFKRIISGGDASLSVENADAIRTSKEEKAKARAAILDGYQTIRDEVNGEIKESLKFATDRLKDSPDSGKDADIRWFLVRKINGKKIEADFAAIGKKFKNDQISLSESVEILKEVKALREEVKTLESEITEEQIQKAKDDEIDKNAQEIFNVLLKENKEAAALIFAELQKRKNESVNRAQGAGDAVLTKVLDKLRNDTSPNGKEILGAIKPLLNWQSRFEVNSTETLRRLHNAIDGMLSGANVDSEGMTQETAGSPHKIWASYATGYASTLLGSMEKVDPNQQPQAAASNVPQRRTLGDVIGEGFRQAKVKEKAKKFAGLLKTIRDETVRPGTAVIDLEAAQTPIVGKKSSHPNSHPTTSASPGNVGKKGKHHTAAPKASASADDIIHTIQQPRRGKIVSSIIASLKELAGSRQATPTPSESPEDLPNPDPESITRLSGNSENAKLAAIAAAILKNIGDEQPSPDSIAQSGDQEVSNKVREAIQKMLDDDGVEQDPEKIVADITSEVNEIYHNRESDLARQQNAAQEKREKEEEERREKEEEEKRVRNNVESRQASEFEKMLSDINEALKASKAKEVESIRKDNAIEIEAEKLVKDVMEKAELELDAEEQIGRIARGYRDRKQVFVLKKEADRRQQEVDRAGEGGVVYDYSGVIATDADEFKAERTETEAEAEAAATKIQSIHRMYAAKKLVAGMKEAKEAKEAKKVSKENQAATAIQAQIRGRLARKQLDDLLLGPSIANALLNNPQAFESAINVASAIRDGEFAQKEPLIAAIKSALSKSIVVIEELMEDEESGRQRKQVAINAPKLKKIFEETAVIEDRATATKSSVSRETAEKVSKVLNKGNTSEVVNGIGEAILEDHNRLVAKAIFEALEEKAKKRDGESDAEWGIRKKRRESAVGIIAAEINQFLRDPDLQQKPLLDAVLEEHKQSELFKELEAGRGSEEGVVTPEQTKGYSEEVSEAIQNFTAPEIRKKIAEIVTKKENEIDKEETEAVTLIQKMERGRQVRVTAEKLTVGKKAKEASSIRTIQSVSRGYQARKQMQLLFLGSKIKEGLLKKLPLQLDSVVNVAREIDSEDNFLSVAISLAMKKLLGSEKHADAQKVIDALLGVRALAGDAKVSEKTKKEVAEALQKKEVGGVDEVVAAISHAIDMDHNRLVARAVVDALKKNEKATDEATVEATKRVAAAIGQFLNDKANKKQREPLRGSVLHHVALDVSLRRRYLKVLECASESDSDKNIFAVVNSVMTDSTASQITKKLTELIEEISDRLKSDEEFISLSPKVPKVPKVLSLAGLQENHRNRDESSDEEHSSDILRTLKNKIKEETAAAEKERCETVAKAVVDELEGLSNKGYTNEAVAIFLRLKTFAEGSPGDPGAIAVVAELGERAIIPDSSAQKILRRSEIDCFKDGGQFESLLLDQKNKPLLDKFDQEIRQILSPPQGPGAEVTVDIQKTAVVAGIALQADSIVTELWELHTAVRPRTAAAAAILLLLEGFSTSNPGVADSVVVNEFNRWVAAGSKNAKAISDAKNAFTVEQQNVITSDPEVKAAVLELISLRGANNDNDPFRVKENVSIAAGIVEAKLKIITSAPPPINEAGDGERLRGFGGVPQPGVGFPQQQPQPGVLQQPLGIGVNTPSIPSHIPSPVTNANHFASGANVLTTSSGGPTMYDNRGRLLSNPYGSYNSHYERNNPNANLRKFEHATPRKVSPEISSNVATGLSVISAAAGVGMMAGFLPGVGFFGLGPIAIAGIGGGLLLFAAICFGLGKLLSSGNDQAMDLRERPRALSRERSGAGKEVSEELSSNSYRSSSVERYVNRGSNGSGAGYSRSDR